MSIAKTISATVKVVTTTGNLGDGGLLDGGTGIQHDRVACLSATPRGHTTVYQSPFVASRRGAPVRKFLKSDTKVVYTKVLHAVVYNAAAATDDPHKSIGVTPPLPKSTNTFWRFVFPRVVVASLMPVRRRFHHEDRTGTPGVPCQPDCS